MSTGCMAAVLLSSCGQAGDDEGDQEGPLPDETASGENQEDAQQETDTEDPQDADGEPETEGQQDDEA